MLKNIKIATRASILITGILLIGFFGLWKVVDQKSSALVEEQIINQMLLRQGHISLTIMCSLLRNT